MVADLGGCGRTYTPPTPLDLLATLSPLRRGRADPAWRREGTAVWWCAATPQGPGSLRLQREGPGVAARAWGAGAGWLLEQVPDLLGARDDPEAFRTDHPLVAGLHRRHPGLRFCRTGLVWPVLAAAVLEQKVTGTEARRSWAWLVGRFGEPAPGPAPPGMTVPPPAEVWRRIPSWEFHRAGVDGKRSATLVRAARVADRLEESLQLADPQSRLRAVPGIGVWTAAEVLQRAHGNPDAPSVGDFHVPALVGWALAGRPVDDAGMLDLLAPFPGHRGRVVRLLERGGPPKPRFGPRSTITDHRAW